MPPSDSEWAYAYAKQAASDLRVRERLLKTAPDLPACHQLHYLQMACEKICKAALYHRSDMQPRDVGSHCVIVKGVEAIARTPGREQSDLGSLRELARVIQQLAPADREVRSNCEYPWDERDGNLNVPCDYGFDPGLPSDPEGNEPILQLLHAELDRLLR